MDVWTEHLTDRPEGSRVFVAEASDDGRIIGFGSAGLVVGPEDEMGFPPARGLQLFTLYVLASAHGTGVGHGLIDALIGTGPAQLWVLQGNERAIVFYERNGFTFDGVRHVHPTLAGVVDLRTVR